MAQAVPILDILVELYVRKFADDFLKVFMFLRNKNNTNYKPCSKKLNSIDNEDLYGMEYRLEDEAVEQVTTYINDLKPLEIPRPENDDSEELYSLPELVSSKITRFLNEFKLHDLYKLLKDNITTLAILISSLGAFIQIFELSSVHVSYLRYFSATQLASDGAVAALILVPLFLGVGVIAQILHHLFEESIEDSNEQLLKSQLFIFIFVGSVSYLCIDFILRGDISLRPISYLAISIGLYFALVGIMALSYRAHKEIINRKYQNKKVF